MFKFSTEKFVQNLRIISKIEKEFVDCFENSEGYDYLMNEMCYPVLRNGSARITLDFSRFTLCELDDVIDNFYHRKANELLKLGRVSEMFECCKPITRKVDFL